MLSVLINHNGYEFPSYDVGAHPTKKCGRRMGLHDVFTRPARPREMVRLPGLHAADPGLAAPAAG